MDKKTSQSAGGTGKKRIGEDSVVCAKTKKSKSFAFSFGAKCFLPNSNGKCISKFRKSFAERRAERACNAPCMRENKCGVILYVLVVIVAVKFCE